MIKKMIEKFRKEIAGKIVNFCIKKAESYNIPEPIKDDTVLGCSIRIIEDLKKESAHLIGVIKLD